MSLLPSSNYENFFLKKIYRSPYLTHVVNQVFYENIGNYNDIRKTINDLCQGGGGKTSGIPVENKTNAMIICYVHMNIIALSEMNY